MREPGGRREDMHDPTRLGKAGDNSRPQLPPLMSCQFASQTCVCFHGQAAMDGENMTSLVIVERMSRVFLTRHAVNDCRVSSCSGLLVRRTSATLAPSSTSSMTVGKASYSVQNQFCEGASKKGIAVLDWRDNVIVPA